MRAMPLVVFVAEGFFAEGSRAPKTRGVAKNEVIELQIASHTCPWAAAYDRTCRFAQRSAAIASLQAAALQ